MFLLLIPFIVAPIAAIGAAIAIPRARFHAAILSGWAAATLSGFAPLGLFPVGMYMERSPLAGMLVFGVVVSGFIASAMMFRRLRRLALGAPLGEARYLVAHHAAVLGAFFFADLLVGEGFAMSTFCAVACAIGCVVVSYRGEVRTAALQPVAF